MELVSIVVVTYNSSDTILETLDSINNQTYRNLELIVSDDCSKDNTVEIVKKWCENIEFPYQVITVNENTGIAQNCNRGIRAATGNYVKFVAGDDLLMENAIEEYYNASHEVSDRILIQAKAICFGDNAEIVNRMNKILNEHYKKLDLEQKMQMKELLKFNYIVDPAVGLIPKIYFREYGMFDDEYKGMEDYPFYFNLSAKGIRFQLLDKELVKYRIRATSVSQSGSKQYKKGVIRFFFHTRLKKMIQMGMIYTAIKKTVYYMLVKIGAIQKIH